MTMPGIHKEIHSDMIIKVVSDFLKVDTAKIIERSRVRAIAFARQVAMYFIRKRCHLTYCQIAEKFHRDHTSVMYAVDRVVELTEAYPEIKQQIEEMNYLITLNQ